jgi:hypothetical protein
MANGNVIRLRRSTTSGTTPLVSNLQTGELSINVYDGKLFFKRSKDGVNTVEQIFTTDTFTTGSLQFKPDTAETNILEVHENDSTSALIITSQSIMTLRKQERATPNPSSGGIMYSGSAFWVGLD